MATLSPVPPLRAPPGSSGKGARRRSGSDGERAPIVRGKHGVYRRDGDWKQRG